MTETRRKPRRYPSAEHCRAALRLLAVGLLAGLSSAAASDLPDPAAAMPVTSTVPRSVPASLPRIVTLLDYFEDGRRAVEAFVDAGLPERRSLRAVIERSRRLCVRVEIRHHHGTAGYESVLGSGVLIDGGARVLTAGHSLADTVRPEVLVTLASGEVLQARVVDRRYEAFGDASRDWAILELPDSPRRPASPLGLGELTPGKLAVILGYPDQIGVNADGRVVHGVAYAGKPLEPLVSIATVHAVQPATLEPVAGAIPTGGISGGPLFDGEGRLVGLFVSLTQSTEGGEVAYRYRVTPVSDLPALLAER